MKTLEEVTGREPGSWLKVIEIYATMPLDGSDRDPFWWPWPDHAWEYR